MAQVAWPGVHPSPVGGGEAPTAQEPQPEPEATPAETPEVTLAATPMDVTEYTDYAADMAAVQSTWDPWPTSARDIHLPAQDALSSPQDDPTPTQEG